MHEHFRRIPKAAFKQRPAHLCGDVSVKKQQRDNRKMAGLHPPFPARAPARRLPAIEPSVGAFHVHCP
jgi:hypothetical protein